MDTANIARACEQWWQEHGGRHDDPAWLSFLANIGTLTTRKIVEHSTAHSNEGRFGMSKAGGCTRYSALKYLGATEVITGSTRFTFQLGHMGKSMASPHSWPSACQSLPRTTTACSASPASTQ